MKGIDSHKKVDLSSNPVLRYYYTDRVWSLLCCFMCLGDTCCWI